MSLLTFSHTGLLSAYTRSFYVCVCVLLFLGTSSCMTSLWKCAPPDTRTPRSKAWIMSLCSAQIKNCQSTPEIHNKTCYHHLYSFLKLLFRCLPKSFLLPLWLHLLVGIPALNARPLGEAKMVQAIVYGRAIVQNEQTRRGELHNSRNTHITVYNRLHKWPSPKSDLIPTEYISLTCNSASFYNIPKFSPKSSPVSTRNGTVRRISNEWRMISFLCPSSLEWKNPKSSFFFFYYTPCLHQLSQ